MSVVQPLFQAQPPKPGWKTTEFWLTLAGSVVSVLPDVLPPAWRGIALLVLPAIYTAGRSWVTGKALAPPPVTIVQPPSSAVVELKAAA